MSNHKLKKKKYTHVKILLYRYSKGKSLLLTLSSNSFYRCLTFALVLANFPNLEEPSFLLLIELPFSPLDAVLAPCMLANFLDLE